MRRGCPNWVKFVLVAVAIAILTKVVTVRRIVWEGHAPVGFGTMVEVNEKLIGRPIWLVSEKQIRRWLEGELVERVEIRRKLPWTLVIVAEPPRLVGVIPKGSQGYVVDENGRKWRKVPLSVTCLPFLMLPENVTMQKCMLAVRQVLDLCCREGIPVKAVWLSQFGEAAIYLPEGFWLRLGNPTALKLKLQLGKLLHRNKLVPSQSVVDLSVPKVISLWEIENANE
ncbi:MAG: hypothetical protein N3B10_08915 [Armatimonadetes bacterium]|nr:hypothetical protein [Armatimonadota bacterium]MCX7968592.1 hypothetical protein [Armatimonadota bacterium]MDW8143369.1 hypothetical protein [Armatimonadota bacterium]